jgi:hypothetical protein
MEALFVIAVLLAAYGLYKLVDWWGGKGGDGRLIIAVIVGGFILIWVFHEFLPEVTRLQR